MRQSVLLVGLIALCGSAGAADDVPAFAVVSVLEHEEALSRPHDIALQGNLAFVAGKGGSVAVIDIGKPAQPEILWWKRGDGIEDAQTVLPAGDVLFLGARDFFAIGIDKPRRVRLCNKLSDRPRIDRINGMVRRGDTILSANKTGWVCAFDVSEPREPVLRGAVKTCKVGRLVSPHDIALFRDHAVVVDQAGRSPVKVRLYRVADERTERILATDEWEAAGAVTDQRLNGANRVVVGGEHAFVACSQSNKSGGNYKVASIDISDPARPILRAVRAFADRHATGLTLSGNALFAAGGRAVEVFDVSDPANPVSTAVFHSRRIFAHGRDSAHDLVYRDGLLYVTAQNDDCIAIIRVETPRIRRLARDDTSRRY